MPCIMRYLRGLRLSQKSLSSPNSPPPTWLNCDLQRFWFRSNMTCHDRIDSYALGSFLQSTSFWSARQEFGSPILRCVRALTFYESLSPLLGTRNAIANR